MEYKKRIIDNELDLKLEAFGATLIVGPKSCGKTTSAKQKAKSYVEFQDEEQRENLLAVAEAAPSKLLIGDKPRLFDEWQDAPKLWGAIRKSVDDLGETGCISSQALPPKKSIPRTPGPFASANSKCIP